MTIEERITELEKEVARLRKERHDTTLRLPLELHDEKDTVVCRIAKKDKHLMLELLNRHGKRGLVLGIDGTDCGFVTVCTADGLPAGFMDVESFGARLELMNLEGSTGIAMQGNDCDGDSGWLKVLSHRNDDEVCLCPESAEEK